MGCPTSKPVIIEFNGLPGSGKTTISLLLKKRIEGLNNIVFLKYYRKVFFCNVYSILLAIRYWRLFFLVKKYSKIFRLKRPLRLCLLYVSYVRMYHDFLKDKSSDILIIDQGVVQSLISLAYKDRVSKNDSLKELLLKSEIDTPQIVFVNCLINEKLAMNRIIARNQKGGRVDSMEAQEMERTLCVQSENFQCIRDEIKKVYSHINFIDIDMEGSAEDNTNVILSQLRILGFIGK